jgi:hypothetical protein
MNRCLGLLGLTACGFHHGVAVAVDGAVDAEVDAALPPRATLFVTDYTGGTLYRYALAPDQDQPDPPLMLALPTALSPLVVPQTGELFVGQNVSASIARFATPLATPTATGTITGNGLSATFGKTVVVDGELWVANAGAANVDRLALDAQGVATSPGTLPIDNSRGLVYVPATRDLYVTQCCGVDTIRHLVVAADHSVTERTPVTGIGLANPHGLWVTPWHELLVASAGSNTIFRFTLDATGTPIANGTITGNDLAVPIDLAMTSWGELYVANGNDPTISRFTFDAAHTAIAHGTITVPGAITLGWFALE